MKSKNLEVKGHSILVQNLFRPAFGLVCVVSLWNCCIVGAQTGFGGASESSVPAPPVNDMFANRTILTGTNILFQSSLVSATEEPGEPVPPYGYGYTGRSVWWSWTAPAKGVASINAINAGLRLGVFTGDVLTNLATVLQIYPADGEDSSSVFETRSNQTYEFMFDSSAEIDLLLASLIFTPSPSDNDFANRINLSGYSFTITTPFLVLAWRSTNRRTHTGGSVTGAFGTNGKRLPAAMLRSHPCLFFRCRWLTPTSVNLSKP